MGNCIFSSCESKSIATAKLIFLDGELQEFSPPVKVSHILRDNRTCFVCSSDEMEFDDFVSAVDVDEELQPGQLYFALPLSWLEQPLQAEDMASLAVKASMALTRSGGGGEKCGCCNRKVGPLIVSDERRVKSSRRTVAAGSGGCDGGLVEEKRSRRRGGGGKGRMFTRKLSMVLEGEE